MTARLLFVVNDASFFLSHRLPLALAARQSGFDVHVATLPGTGVDAVSAAGFQHHPLPLNRNGMNPLRELRVLLAMVGLFRRVEPQLVHLVTIKPVIYGGLAARFTGVPGVVAAISGLGFLFTQRDGRAGWRRALARWLYRPALGHRNLRVIFQNPEDAAEITAATGLPPERGVLIRGSGVRLSDYPCVAEPLGRPVVVMAARLLHDKGVVEFVRAARLLRDRGVTARFVLAGAPDSGNPSACTADELASWREEGVVEFPGYCRDIPALFAASHLVVLPSYREGLPKVLIEAAACGRPTVTTDVPGCRDAVQSGRTGLLVPVGDAGALADAIGRLLDDAGLRQRMGLAGRMWAEQAFDVEGVIQRHLEIYGLLLRSAGQSNGSRPKQDAE
jgi:glycosyltransferase involved in cell wall biosynthesis